MTSKYQKRKQRRAYGIYYHTTTQAKRIREKNLEINRVLGINKQEPKYSVIKKIKVFFRFSKGD